MESLDVPRKLWEHSDPKSTDMYKLMQEINQKQNLNLDSFWDLYQYSVQNRAQFYHHLFHFVSLIYSGTYTTVVDESARIDSVPHWFSGVHINFAENLLYTRVPGAPTSQRGTIGKEDSKVALTEVREGGTKIRTVTWGQLRKEVSTLAAAMKAWGVGKGDRIVAVASNSVDTLKVFLAVTTLGGLFSSSSTDMGVQGILQRTLQISPKFIFMDDLAIYNGKKIDLGDKMTQIVQGMKDIPEFKGLVSIPRFYDRPKDISSIPRTQTLASFLSKASGQPAPAFENTAFRDPFLIAYSSGTTGMPKCIVHSIGGCLLNGVKEGGLHREISATSTTLQYTTTGWIMYFAQVMNLLPGAHAILYDGSPFQPNPRRFVELLGELRVTDLGISPRWMQEMVKNNIVPKDVTDLSNLKGVTSTGMVLPDHLFEWFYDVAFPSKVHLCNISGGTDLAGCFGIENPLTPVYVGGTQGPSLGVPIAVYDSLIEGGRGVKGVPVDHGTPGELVATAAFPNMPVFFWNDKGGERYFSAYFEKYDNVWTHGDFVMIHPTTKNLLFLGRADGVLNPSGVRFGSAEIYSVLENGFPQLVDAICVGQRRPKDIDESVMLFCLMKAGEKLTTKLINDIKAAIRKELSPRHVPKYIFETPAIPTTVNLKKVELPVKQIVSGKIIKPSGTLLNPESLDYYYQFAKVEELLEPKNKL
ncbi:acetoacetyl-CoA synthetase-like protein [Xylogone sp. PMI_703]|nr:acetoacetyl-CoA synthetase-like protein [Xylogone sp. PMI_703]